MRYALAALMACTLIACESHEDIVEEVDRNVSRQLEQKFKDEGFEDAYCLLVGPGLVQLNDAQYKGVVRCRDGVLGGEEGKFGEEESDIPESKIPKVDAWKLVDEIDVKNISVNKALGSKMLGAGPLKNIFGNQEGFDSKMNVAMSGEGGELVVGRGAGGMGFRGTGKGGGGEGFGRIGGLGKVDIKILVTKDGDEYMWETQ